MVGFLLHGWPQALQRLGLSLFSLGVLTFPSAELLAVQRTLVMSCSGSITASNLSFTAVYSSEEGFSDIQLSRGGTAIAAAQLSLGGRTDSDQDIWRGTTYGNAEVILIHLSAEAAKPGDAISVSHNGQWGRGQCDGYYWYSNQA